MKSRFSTLLAIALLTLAPSLGHAWVDWEFEEGDAYSRVLCRVADDTDGPRTDRLYVEADEVGRGPLLSCVLENYEIVDDDGDVAKKLIHIDRLVWGPRDEEGRQQRRYFVLPEVCFKAEGTWRCRKQEHVKNRFVIDLPATCPYTVKIGALPIVNTCVDDQTPAPLNVAGTMQLPDGTVTSNPFSFHPDLDVDGAYYRDLAIVRVSCPPEPLVQPTCGNGILEPGELCDDGNANDDDLCDRRCTPPTCGDGTVDHNEVCDDGNRNNDDSCNNDCQPPQVVPPSCGDGIVQLALNETCEPGMILAPVSGGIPDRACTASCNYCGDGIVHAGEECDDGNSIDDDSCRNDCALPPQVVDYRYCEMFRDPSFSRDQQGNVRLKANGRMGVLDASVASASDPLVVDLPNERVIVRASTPEDGIVFEQEFLPGSLSYYERSGNRGWEHNNGGNDFMTLRIQNTHSRFKMELPGDSRMDDLLNLVEAGQVTERLVKFQIRFEEERIICQAETWWDCKDTGNRGHCKGLLQ